jgi:metallo-beta-lactamase family protein
MVAHTGFLSCVVVSPAMDGSPTLTFLGGARTVTGSKYLIRTERGRQVLIDCGLFQGPKALRLRNWAAFDVDPAEIDAVVLTHAHVDHCGYLPRLVNSGFTGPVYATRGTVRLCSIVLPDSGHLQEEEADFANRMGYSKHHPALPLYTEDDALRSLDQFVEVPFGEATDVTSDLEVSLDLDEDALAGALLGGLDDASSWPAGTVRQALGATGVGEDLVARP